VITAMNGQQGLERLGDQMPSLVLLDFMMPIVNRL
jgi:CheY-like chemotaxis protein